MRKSTLCAALTLLCGGCAIEPPAPPLAAAPPDCRPITTTATIDGKPQEVKGFACRAADGTWQLTAPMADAPILLPSPYEYAWYDPLWGWWGPPLGVDASFFFFGPGRFDRFHRFVHRDRGFVHHEGFSHRMRG
jgi:hypothetical protein